MKPMPRFEKVKVLLLGIVLASAFFAYGLYALYQASCAVIGRGNFPLGTLLTFHGTKARVLSTIYLGAGLWLFSGLFLSKLQKLNNYKWVSWLGACLLVVGLVSLLVILCLPLIGQ